MHVRKFLLITLILFTSITLSPNLPAKGDCSVKIVKTNLTDLNCHDLGDLKNKKKWRKTLKEEFVEQEISEQEDVTGKIDSPDADKITDIIHRLGQGYYAQLSWEDRTLDQVGAEVVYKTMLDELIKNNSKYNFVLLSKPLSAKGSLSEGTQYFLVAVNAYKDWLGKFFVEDPDFNQFYFNNDYHPFCPIAKKFKALDLYECGTGYENEVEEDDKSNLSTASSRAAMLNPVPSAAPFEGYFSIPFITDSKYLVASKSIVADEIWQQTRFKSLYNKNLIYRESISEITDALVVDHVLVDLVFEGTDQYTEIKNAVNKALEFIGPQVGPIDETYGPTSRDVRIAWIGNKGSEVYKSYYDKLIKDIYDPSGTLFKRQNDIALPSLFNVEGTKHYLLIITLIPYTEDRTKQYSIEESGDLKTQFAGKTVLCLGDGRLTHGYSPIAEYLNAYAGATAYSVDIAYDQCTESINKDRKRINQDITVEESEFTAKVQKIIPEGLVDYVLGEEILCCIACSNRVSDTPDSFDKVKTRNAILNVIAVLKDGGKAKLKWIPHCIYRSGVNGEIVYMNVKDKYESITKQIMMEKPGVDIKIYEHYDATKDKLEYTMTITKKSK